jgi:enoyl-CoA hydratase/carnithine racemase
MKTIVLSGPGKNALSTQLMETTLAAFRAAGDEPVLLTGEGDAFSAGLHLKELASLDEAGARRFLTTLEELVAAIFAHPGPTVAWVNGHAIAGGCVLALCCDLRIMTAREGTRIGLNEVALGVRFPPRTFAMVRARLTAPALERALLEAALYGAEEALSLGLVHALGDEAAAKAKLAALAAHPRDAYAYAKRALRGTLDVSEAEQRRFLEETVPDWVSPQRKEGLRAILMKK